MNYKRVLIIVWLLIISVIIGASVSYAASQCGDNSCTLPNITTGKINSTVFYDKDNISYYIDPANTGTSGVFAGSVGIGTTNPASPLDIRNTAIDGNANGIIMGYNSQYFHSFSAVFSSGASSNILGINVNNGTGTGQIRVMSLAGNGDIGIGTTSFPSSGGTPVLVLGNAVNNPTGCVNGTAGLITKAGHIYSWNDACTTTIISPHPTEFLDTLPADENHTSPWVYQSENPYTGKRITVDMELLAHLVEKANPGNKLIYDEKIDKRNWVQDQIDIKEKEDKSLKEEWIQQQIKNATDIEISPDVAFQTVTESQTVDTQQIIGYKLKYKYNAETGMVTSVSMPVYGTQTIYNSKKKLKDNVRFDEDSGKFFRKPERSDFEAQADSLAPKYQIPEIPKWMKNRGVS